MDRKIAIVAENLKKNYGRLQALRGVNLEVAQGDIFGFLGPNGAGKTTTIRCMLDLIRPNSGLLRILGLDPQKQAVQVRARCGYLPGELAFEGNMSVESALRYLAHLRGKGIDWNHTRRLAERLDLDLKPQFKNLSKGNKQKVGILQALMHRPALLLLDEPTAGLDPLMQHAVLSMVREAKDDGATVFFSSHIIREVEDVAEKVGIIRSGSVVEVADVAALKRRALRRVRLKSRAVLPAHALEEVAGVSVLSQDDPLCITLQVEGEMDTLIKTLAKYPISEFETERPSLEEIFMAFYAQEEVR